MLEPEIAAYLVAQGFGALDVDVFAVPFPQSAPDAAVCVTALGGRSQGTFGASLSAAAFDEAEFQVIVRGGRDAIAAARTKAQNIRAKLNRLGPVTLASTVYMDVRASLVTWLRYDPEGRPLYSIRCETEAA